MSEGLLNVSAVRVRTRTNGPGWRAAVWVQGCSIRCTGCFNPETHLHERRKLWEPEALARRMMSADTEVEGISILGGEPFEQAAASARLATEARRLGGSVVTYSGYTWAYLDRCRLRAVQRLLEATDLLIAGPYISSLATDGEGWRGSRNQQFVFLSDRYDESVSAGVSQLPTVEVWTDGAVAGWTGIPAGPRCDPLLQLRTHDAASVSHRFGSLDEDS